MKSQVGALNIQPRNLWGWYVVSGMVEGYRIEVRFDRKPTYSQAREALLSEAKRLHIA
jgi:hypothetical protein